MGLLFWRTPDFLRKSAAKKKARAAMLRRNASAKPASAHKMLGRATQLEMRAKTLEAKAGAAEKKRRAKQFEKMPAGLHGPSLDARSAAQADKIVEGARHGQTHIGRAGAAAAALDALARGEEPGAKRAAKAVAPEPQKTVSPQRQLANLLRKQGCPKNPARDANFIAALRQAGFKNPEKIAKALQAKIDKGKIVKQIVAELEGKA
ncbi:MAG: hypothetical protein NTW59_01010 [Candidatus Diapherotrites archaeon]|nr:hypothetical protein [Candidatus Diapherotrites archaeon]